MAGVNKVILLGYVGTDPEIRNLEGGSVRARFRLATTEIYKDKDGTRVDHTEWHNVVAWRALADIVGKYLKKGNQVYIEGKLRTRQWEDKEGNKKQITEVVAETINLVGKRDRDEIRGSEIDSRLPVDSNLDSADFSEFTADDLPF